MARIPKVVISGLDVGASKTIAVITGYSSGVLHVLGLGEYPTSVMSKGAVSDPEALITSIRNAFKDAEKAAGIKAPLVFAGYDLVNKALRSCRTVPGNSLKDIPSGERVLCLLPGKPDFSSPQDGEVMEARAVTASAGGIDLFLSCVRKAGLNLAEVVYTPLAGAAVLMSAAEKEVGAVLIDIGASKTSVSYFSRGFLKETAILQLCGGHIIGDLAVGLRTTMGEARRIVTDLGRAGGDKETEGPVAVRGLDGKGKKEVSLAYIKKIIEARIQEFTEIVAECFEDFGCSEFLPGGVVLAGGGAQLPGLVGWMEKRLQVAVRVGKIEVDGAALDLSQYNAFGLAKYGLAGLATTGKKNFNILNSDFWSNFISQKAARFLRIDS